MLRATALSRSPHRQAATLAAGYAAFGTVWVVFSDRWLADLAANNVALISAIGLWKGLGFVFATSALLYIVRHAAAGQAPTEPTWSHRAGPAALLWALGLSGALLLSLGLREVANNARDNRVHAERRLQATAAFKAELAMGWLAARRAEADSLQRDADLRDLVERFRPAADDKVRQRMGSHLRALLIGSEYSHVWLLDRTGTVLMSVGDGPAAPSAPELALVEQAVAAGAMRDSGLYFSSEWPGAPEHFAAALAIGRVPGRPDGVVLLRTDIRRSLAQSLHSWTGAGDGERIRVVNTHGGRLQFMAAGDAAASDAAAATDPAAGLLQRPPHLGPSLLEGSDADGLPLLAAAVPLPDSHWYVIAQRPIDDLQDKLWQDAAWLSVMTVLSLLAASAVVFGVWQRREAETAHRAQAEQQRRLDLLNLLQAITSSTDDVVFAKDREGRYLYVNDECCRRLNRSADEMIGRHGSEFFPEHEARRATESDRQVMERQQPTTEELTLTIPGGRRHYLMTKGPLRDAAGRLIGIVGSGRDITERVQLEHTRRQWAEALESMRDGVMITDAEGRIEAVNRAFTDITGHAREQSVGQLASLLQSGRHDAFFYRAMWQDLVRNGSWKGEVWDRRRNGEIFPASVNISAVRDAAGRTVNYVAVLTDITSLKESEDRLQHLAHYDSLTGLPNRRLLQQQLEQSLAYAHRHHARVAALYLDLDGFKTVNDSLGHPAGDELLCCVAQRLSARLRGEDVLGRLGGDEYLVVLRGIGGPEQAAAVARDLLLAVAQPVRLSGGTEVYVTASIGISIHPDDGSTTVIEMLRDADAALYRAKEAGRNRFCFYTSDLHQEAVARLEIEMALSQAIERDEFELHYQPKVDATGALTGAEALLRWRRSDGELMPPGRFIPIAERSSTVLHIGAWVIDQACRQLRQWLDDELEPVPLAVNVAARQFETGDLDRVLRDALQRHGVPPRYLEVELTESMLMERPQAAQDQLARIEALGVRISLDDFGTGYSSLGYLQRFTIDALKIDQSFVRTIGQHGDGGAIVDAVVALAHRLRLKVVAEGVETAAQRDYLIACGCDEMQGYLFAPPRPASALQALLSRQACPA
jgi:diguanylate cyclase (GGDEF)-like protein/PAS domain S-box-containing protein